MFELKQGDCLEVLKTLADNSVDAVVTDPPYGIRFMGKAWDGADIEKKHEERKALASRAEGSGPNGGYRSAAAEAGKYDITPSGMLAFQDFTLEYARECLRVLKPGGHLASFSSTRTYHRMACAIEDAGFEIRDQLAWVYGQGFPKSMNLAKALDKEAGEKGTLGDYRSPDHAAPRSHHHERVHEGYQRPWQDDPEAVDATLRTYIPATEPARQWSGWGTALKPSWEPICLARKPLSEKTVAANVLRWGTGAINVGACKIEQSESDKAVSVAGALRMSKSRRADNNNSNEGWQRPWQEGDGQRQYIERAADRMQASVGRFPANLCHDGSDEVLDLFPETKAGGVNRGAMGNSPFSGIDGSGRNYETSGTRGHIDSGSAARYFYCAKASKADRALSRHPTVKPIKLMQWLCRLVTPPGGVVLDPFAGSGTTGAAAILEGFRPVLIEREDEYVADIRRRLGLHGASDAVITHDTLGEVA